MALQIRRGTNAQRLAITPLQGELILVTDYVSASVAPLWVGDGTTVGGVASASLSLNDLTDVTLTSPTEGHTLYYDQTTTQWRNTGIITVSDTNNRVGINVASPNFALDVSGSAYLSGDLTVAGNDIASSTATAITLSGSNVSVQGNLRVIGNNIESSTGGTALTLNGSNVTVVGDLTVNGTTTTVNSTTLTVDDKNIELGSVATPTDVTADGGGITLKGATDKEISWRNSDDRWIFDSGDGVDHVIPYQLTDLEDASVSSPSKGELLVYDGTNFSNTNQIEFDSTNQRTRFQNNTGSAGVASGATVTKKTTGTGGSNWVTGDGTGLLMGLQDSNTTNIFGRVAMTYDSGNNHKMLLSTTTDQFASSNSGKILLSVDDDDAKFKATEIMLNATGTASAAVDAYLTVERGTTGADSYLKWNEGSDQWEFNYDLSVTGNLSNTGDIFSNGNLYINNDGVATDTYISFGYASGPLYKTLHWDQANAWFEFNDDLFTAGDFIATGFIGTNGNDLYFNNADTGTGSTSTITVKRGTNADVALRWNETSDRWETTVDGTNYITIPNQGLDSGNSPTFAGITAGNVQIGVSDDNSIFNNVANLSISAGTGFIVSIPDTLSVDSGVLYVDAANNRVGINDTSPSVELDVNGSISVTGSTTLGNDVSSDFLIINSSVTTDIQFANPADNTLRGIRGTVGTNDVWGVFGLATGTSLGSLIIATGDDGTEPILVRQYSDNTFTTPARTLTLLDQSGHTELPGQLTVTGNIIKSSTDTVFTLSGNDVTVGGDVTVNGVLYSNDVTSANTTLDINSYNAMTIQTTANNADITIRPHGNGDVELYTDTTIIGDNGSAANIHGRGTWDVILATNSGSTDTSKITLSHNGGITLDPDSGTGAVDGHWVIGELNTDAILSSNGTGNLNIRNGDWTSGRANIELNNGDNANIDITTHGTGRVTMSGGLSVDTDTIYVDAASSVVGIGTNTPGAKLDVVGSIRGQARLVMSSHNDVANAEALTGDSNFVHYIETGATGETATLAAPTLSGTIQTFAMTLDGGGDMVITVTNPAWGGAGTMTFNTVGQGCTLIYVNSKWCCIGNNGVAFA